VGYYFLEKLKINTIENEDFFKQLAPNLELVVEFTPMISSHGRTL
jgi:hypothetical protein